MPLDEPSFEPQPTFRSTTTNLAPIRVPAGERAGTPSRSESPINGGGGSDTLDFSGRSTAVTVTLVAGGTNKATATGGWANISTV